MYLNIVFVLVLLDLLISFCDTGSTADEVSVEFLISVAIMNMI